jgi:GrpB-like predicted nucleotidyltransferase (UPF0157 family)
MKTRHVIVTPYNPEWAIWFEEISVPIKKWLGNLIISIEHVGSTSVVGLAAKPIIDIDIIIEKMNWEAVRMKLTEIGYQYEGDLGNPGRESFSTEIKQKENLPAHHLYVCDQKAPELIRHLKFRDYLRTHPEEVREYGNLKLKLAKQFPEDIDQYMKKKNPLIKRILKKALIN